MDILEIASRPVVTVEMDDSLSVVKEIFDNTAFHHLLVIRYEKLVGILSDRDLLRALSPNIGTLAETNRDTATLNRRVHQIMTRKPFVLQQDASIEDAIRLFNTRSISCIPVVDDQLRPLGVVSWRDILLRIAKAA